MVLSELDLSLGEADALITKAARGAGYPWGIAAEIGAAARRLIASGTPDAASAFADFLDAAARALPDADRCPVRRGLLTLDGGRPAAPKTDHPLVEAAFAAGASTGTRCRMDSASYARLDALAARTYAPATEESRKRGAG